jgi:hypothetical protein
MELGEGHLFSRKKNDWVRKTEINNDLSLTPSLHFLLKHLCILGSSTYVRGKER